MKLQPFACLAGVEFANDARTAAYVANVGLPEATMPDNCACAAYDEGNYNTPSADPAPWYEPTRQDSDDFYGFYATNMRLDSVYAREVVQTGSMGSTLSPLRAKGRNVLVNGLMLARSSQGMAYGERWLSAVLRGSPCHEGGCPGDDLTILPACPESVEYASATFFRTLVGVGLVDGPTPSQVSGITSECLLQQVSFVLSSSMPQLYHPTTRCVDEETLGSSPSCTLTTPDWMGDGTFYVDIASQGVANCTGITITGRISLDGSCPVDPPGSSVPPSFQYTVPVLGPHDRIVIDGIRRQALYYDASCKSASSALPYTEFDGPWPWPDVGPCTTMCVTVTGSGDATVIVETALREM